MTLHCAICSREVMFVADPYDLPEGVGMAVEDAGKIYCSRCFIELRERATSERATPATSSAAHAPATCRVCGKKLARGEVGMCYSCYVQQERSRFPQCDACGALLPRTRGWRDPLAPKMRVERSQYQMWHERTAVTLLCLACAERYTPEEGWLWVWENGALWITWAPWEPELQRRKEEALQELLRRIEQFGELPPKG